MKTPILLTTLLTLTALAGCLNDTAEEVGDTDTTPTDPGPGPSFNVTQPASVTGLEHVARLAFPDGSPYPSGSGIWVHGDTVYGSSLGNGFFIADISDPAHPVLLYNATTDGDDESNTITSFARDADLVAHPDGRRTLVLATQTDGMHVWDVTDRAAPEFLARVEVDPNHNVAVVPGTTLVWNSQSGGLGRSNDLVDLTDPTAPVVVGAYGTHGCHDIAFHGVHGDDRFRAYCAGIDRTEIWDLTGLDPDAAGFGITLVGVVEGIQDSPVVGNPAFQSAPLRTLHHLAMVDEDAEVLIIGDEQNGGGSPGGCYLYDETTGRSTPFGALWFYDLSDETAPALTSWLSPSTVQPTTDAPEPTDPLGATSNVPNCTAHFGTLVPGEDKLAMSWYSAGVVLIDFSDLANPVILDQFQEAPINTWDARVHGGYVFTGDMVRGMDVLRLV